MLSQQTMIAWVSALQAHALQAPGTCSPLIQAALAASLELPTEHSIVVLEGLADVASKAGKLLLHSQGVVGLVWYYMWYMLLQPQETTIRVVREVGH